MPYTPIDRPEALSRGFFCPNGEQFGGLAEPQTSTILALMKNCIAIFLIAFLAACQSPPVVEKPRPVSSDPALIDRTVAAMPRPASIQSLITALKARWVSDADRARAAYAWVAHNIDYDVDAYFSGVRGKTDAGGTFETGKSVCEGYSDLYAQIAKGLGLEVQSISGWAKGYGYGNGEGFGGVNHAWNAVKVDGRWRLLDTTWGAGSISGKHFKRSYSTAWYDMDPRLFILQHLPQQAQWTLLDQPPSMAAYVKAPYLEYWHLESLHSAGFSADEQLALVAHAPFAENFGLHAAAFRRNGGSTDHLLQWLKERAVPVVWSYAAYPARILDVPRQGRLEAGKTYHFALELEGASKVAVINGGQFFELAREGRRFSGQVQVSGGDVRLEALIKNEGVEGYWPLLVWR